MAKDPLQKTIDAIMRLAKQDRAFYRALITDPDRALRSKKLGKVSPTHLQEVSRLIKAKGTRFTVRSGKRSLTLVDSRGRELDFIFPFQGQDWFITPWYLLHKKKSMRLKSHTKKK